MSILKVSTSHKSDKGAPHERVQLTPSLIAAIWQREDRKGNLRISWSIDRHNAADPAAPFRMCNEEDVLELGLFASKLSMALAKKETLPMDLRKRLARYANLLSQLDELLLKDANGEDKEPASIGNTLLSFEE